MGSFFPTPSLPQRIPSDERVGGRLSRFLPVWEGITQSPHVLQIIREGYRLEFRQLPPPTFLLTHLPSDPLKASGLSQNIFNLAQQGVIVPVPLGQEGQGVYSHIFVVPKPSGKFRLIINLRPLNVHLQYKKFRMENVYSLRGLLLEGVFMVTIDLRDAYLHVPICLDHQRFLRFALASAQGIQHWQFSALPFGLASSPRVFTKVLAEVMAFLHLKGISLVPYLDDLLLFNLSRDQLLTDLATVMTTLESLGWIVNREKSSLLPEQRKMYLGFLIDSLEKKLVLTQDKAQGLMAVVRSLVAAVDSSLREIMRLLGRMTSCIPAVPWAQLHSRPLQAFLLSSWDGTEDSLDSRVSIPVLVKDTLEWWLCPQNLLKGRLWSQSNPIKVTTDASSWGWGAHAEELRAQGSWNHQQRRASSNYRELSAVGEALVAFEERLRGREVLVLSDNATTVAFLNRQGGTRSHSLLALSLRILGWVEQRVPSLLAVHIRGSLNLEADFLSRQPILQGEWELCPETFSWSCQQLGHPEIDLFARKGNRKVNKFFSLSREQGSQGVDALAQLWNFQLAYAFPPLNLIPRVLQKLNVSDTNLILITPWWPKRAWFPTLKHWSLASPLPIPLRADLLRQGPISHPNPEFFSLTAWLLRGGTCSRGDARRR